ncbi:MAG: hypothetical protein WCL44_12240 [bacterium]
MRMFLIIATAMVGSLVQAASLSVRLSPDAENPTMPTMGDNMRFHSVITATAEEPVDGVVAWISLVEIDPGREQPVDLEDWSAHKAVSAARLEPGEELETTWPMRLIQDGDYRVVVSVTARNQDAVFASSTVQFHVTRKPVVESRRIFPVAIGLPVLLLGMLGYRRWHVGHFMRPSAKGFRGHR